MLFSRSPLGKGPGRGAFKSTTAFLFRHPRAGGDPETGKPPKGGFFVLRKKHSPLHRHRNLFSVLMLTGSGVDASNCKAS